MKNYNEVMDLMASKYKGKDTLIALATLAVTDPVAPAVRLVNSCYEDGSIYISSDTRKNKSIQIEKNNKVSVCDMHGSSFTGTAEILGWVKDNKNEKIYKEFKNIFEWFSAEGDEDNPSSIIIKINYTKGVIFDEENRYEIDFVNQSVK